VWGYNGYGQLGIGNTRNELIPQNLSFFDEHKLKSPTATTYNNNSIPSISLIKLQQQQSLCDMILKTKDKAIGVHSSLISVRCPKLLKMTSTELSSMDSSQLEALLTWIYEGNSKIHSLSLTLTHSLTIFFFFLIYFVVID
jgi:hypothetical protein